MLLFEQVTTKADKIIVDIFMAKQIEKIALTMIILWKSMLRLCQVSLRFG